MQARVREEYRPLSGPASIRRVSFRGPLPLPAPLATVIGLPFANLNLRRNPFGEPAEEDRAGLAVVDPDFLDGLERSLSEPGFAVQFIGDCGRGKSTHLHALRARFPDAPYVYFAEGERPQPIPGGPVLFLDETQRLPWRTRRRLFGSDVALALGTHRDHSRELVRAGRRVETVRLTGFTTSTLRRIIERRIEWARRGPGPVPSLGPGSVARLHDRFDGDLRAIEGHLYDVFQTLPVPEELTFA
jgi:hypothetical protein